MANFKRDVFLSVVGRRRAGSDLTQVIATAPGRRGTGIPWVTKDRWLKLGFIKRVGDRLVLTAKGASVKSI